MPCGERVASIRIVAQDLAEPTPADVGGRQVRKVAGWVDGDAVSGGAGVTLTELGTESPLASKTASRPLSGRELLSQTVVGYLKLAGSSPQDIKLDPLSGRSSTWPTGPAVVSMGSTPQRFGRSDSKTGI